VVVTHGGITTELLRNLLDDDALPPQLLAAGIPHAPSLRSTT
jgi:hypothetical protein